LDFSIEVAEGGGPQRSADSSFDSSWGRDPHNRPAHSGRAWANRLAPAIPDLAGRARVAAREPQSRRPAPSLR